MFEKELKERVIMSISISPFILIVALPITSFPLYIAFIYLFFIILALVLLFEVIRMFEYRYFYVPKIKKAIFVLLLVLFLLVSSSLSLAGKNGLQESIEFVSLSRDVGYVFTVLMSLFVVFLFLNLMISSLNISKHNYFIVDSIFSITVLYISICVGAMLVLKLVDIDNKVFMLPFVLGVGWFSEAGALIVGKLLGKVKLSFLASPNKTLEGTLGMIVFGVIGGIIFKFVLNLLGYQSLIFLPTYGDAVVLSLVVVVFGFFGDIIESLIKRFFEVKDSRNILKSLGGLFDVFDGVMFASFGVMLYYFIGM